jgi:hypothetical protein
MKKNIFKLLGIAVLVTVIGFSMTGCESLGSLLSTPSSSSTPSSPSLDGVWESGNLVVTVSGSTGVFTEVKSGSWIPLLDNGTIKIGDSKFRNLKYEGKSRWTCQQLVLVTRGSNVSTDWRNTEITLSGNTFKTITTGVADVDFARK